MNHEEDQYKIPAFQRKKSIAAKANLKMKIKKISKKSSGKKKQEVFLNPDLANIPARDEPILNDFASEKLKALKKSKFVEMKVCGTCTGYFEKIDVAVLKLTSPIRKDDVIIIEKEDGLFQQVVESMQIDRKNVALARSGSEIGIKLFMQPKVGGYIYKVV